MDPDRARAILHQERERLTSLARRMETEGLDAESERDSLSELSGMDQHPADVGTETFERTKDLAILEGIQADIDNIDRALHKVDGGTYGVCELCGNPIPDERLEALPGARFCVADQSKVEHDLRAATQGEPPHGLF